MNMTQTVATVRTVLLLSLTAGLVRAEMTRQTRQVDARVAEVDNYLRTQMHALHIPGLQSQSFGTGA
jgi:hypothetical protein